MLFSITVSFLTKLPQFKLTALLHSTQFPRNLRNFENNDAPMISSVHFETVGTNEKVSNGPRTLCIRGTLSHKDVNSKYDFIKFQMPAAKLRLLVGAEFEKQ
jgi:hypothetical protein